MPANDYSTLVGAEVWSVGVMPNGHGKVVIELAQHDHHNKLLTIWEVAFCRVARARTTLSTKRWLGNLQAITEVRKSTPNDQGVNLFSYAVKFDSGSLTVDAEDCILMAVAVIRQGGSDGTL